MARHNKATAYTLKNDSTAAIRDGGWILYWHPGRDMYVVRPTGEGREAEGDEYSRFADALSDLRSYARAERQRPASALRAAARAGA